MSSVEILLIVAGMLGGLALFLTGMETLSESLTSLTGGTLKKVIGSITKNRFLAFAFGTVVTAIVQSSSAITVLSVGLVNSGLIEISKAAGLIIGANLGTTATAWVLSLNAIDGQSLIMTLIKPSTFSPFLAIIGVVMKMFGKSEKKQSIGTVLLGFAIMMIGMNLMGQAVSPLRDVPVIRKTLVSFTNPVLGFLFACAFAMLIQSSDAVIGIVQAFALSMGITFGMAIPLVCGSQVGTCVTAMISSLGASNNGKRTALINLYYNLLKTVPFLLVFYTLNHFLGFSFLESEVGGVGIPVFHTLVNLLGCAIWLPLSNVLVSLAMRTLPLSEREKQDQANRLTMLDRNLLVTPDIAIEQANTAVTLLSKVIGDAFQAVIDMEDDPQQAENAAILCERSQKYRSQINEYLLEISEKDIDRKSRAYLRLISAANTAFGRMGKLAERMRDMTAEAPVSEGLSSEEEQMEFSILGSSIFEIIQLTLKGFTSKSDSISQTIRCYREEIMELASIIKKRYIRRMHEKGLEMDPDNRFADISYILEQLIDYCDMVADALIRYHAEIGDEEHADTGTDETIRKNIHMLFEDKYEALGIR